MKWTYLLHNALENIKMVSKLYQYLGVDQPNNSVIKQKKKSLDSELVLTVYHEQRTMKDIKEMGARESN